MKFSAFRLPPSSFLLEALPVERRARVLLCEAPLVEGALAAAVQARMGSSLEQVAAEARGALAAKVAHLAGTGPAPTPGPSPVESAPTKEGGIGSLPLPALPLCAGSRTFATGEGLGMGASLRLTARNRLGLHARPAARFVQTASRFDADVRLSNLTAGRGPVNARSINAVATLGVRQGDEIEITASGPQAEAALAALRALAADNFGDDERRPT